MGRQADAVRQGRDIDPADDTVAAGAAPDLIVPTLEDIKAFAEDQLVRLFGGGLSLCPDRGDGDDALHRGHRAVGGGRHESLQRLLGQIGPGERGAGIQGGSENGQTGVRTVEPLF